MWIKLNDGNIIDASGKSIIATETGEVVLMDFQSNYFTVGAYLRKEIAENIVNDIFEEIEAGSKTYVMPQGVE